MSGPTAVWLLMGVALTVYTLTGGADFGAGLWDLLARGPEAPRKREALERAIAPIWEANHVWLVFLVVLCFTVYPIAFEVASVALNVPLTLVLVGIVLRGAAFVFRAYGFGDARRGRWGRVFAGASAITPLFLGASLGALATGAIRYHEGAVRSGLLAGWTTPFALLTGAFALALFALLAAVYMTVATESEPSLAEQFRRDAFGAEVVAGALAAATWLAALRGAPPIATQLARSGVLLPIQLGTAAAAFGVLWALWQRAYRWARAAVVLQVVGVVLGFGVGMRGYLVYPDVPLEAAGSQAVTIAALARAIPLGLLLLIPSLAYLYHVFALRPVEPERTERGR